MSEFIPISVLLLVAVVVITRLPTVEVGHSAAFRRRRVLNWLPLGLTYAFLYMGRYNLTVSKGALGTMADDAGNVLMSNADFGVIFGIGTAVYGASFLINGPLTDRHGGKVAILIGAAGALVMNTCIGLCTWTLVERGPAYVWVSDNLSVLLAVLYGGNMYFQSFGAVAIVKVNAPWFHVRERGVFGAIFGMLISLGIYFAFDVGKVNLQELGLPWVFFVPAILLGLFLVLDFFVVRTTPAAAGFDNFDTADASSGDDGPQLGAFAVLKLMLKSPVIMTIAGIEFCSGFLRQSVMQWFKSFAEQTDAALGLTETYIYDHWGMFLCLAGIIGGTLAGLVSDHVFQSRRGPVAGLLYAVMLVGAIVLVFVYDTPLLGPVVVLMSMCVIGVHGMLSGTASMDFGGHKNAGIAVGLIDGFVYAGTAVMAFTSAKTLPEEQLDASGGLIGPATDPDNWLSWPLAMIVPAVLGLLLAFRVWNAKPKPRPTA